MSETTARDRGLIDTSIVIALDQVDPDILPSELAIAAVTLAELAAGPHATDDLAERARRQERLQRTEATFDAFPFDAECARAYGRVYAQSIAGGRKARGRRAIDAADRRDRPRCRPTACTAPTPTTSPGLGGLIDLKPIKIPSQRLTKFSSMNTATCAAGGRAPPRRKSPPA